MDAELRVYPYIYAALVVETRLLKKSTKTNFTSYFIGQTANNIFNPCRSFIIACKLAAHKMQCFVMESGQVSLVERL